MAFENGYDIKEYIGETISRFDKNNNIFETVISRLHIYMLRKEWPFCIKEFENESEYILGDSSENICRTISMFVSQEKKGNENIKGWDNQISEECKIALIGFNKVIFPIFSEYYSYMKNPFGLEKIIGFKECSDGRLFRIFRTDGEYFDLKMDNDELKNFIKYLSSLLINSNYNKG